MALKWPLLMALKWQNGRIDVRNRPAKLNTQQVFLSQRRKGMKALTCHVRKLKQNHLAEREWVNYQEKSSKNLHAQRLSPHMVYVARSPALVSHSSVFECHQRTELFCSRTMSLLSCFFFSPTLCHRQMQILGIRLGPATTASQRKLCSPQMSPKSSSWLQSSSPQGAWLQSTSRASVPLQ